MITNTQINDGFIQKFNLTQVPDWLILWESHPGTSWPGEMPGIAPCAAWHQVICDLSKQLDFYPADFETFVGKYICVDRNYFVRSKNIFKVLWPHQGAGDRGPGPGWESQ